MIIDFTKEFEKELKILAKNNIKTAKRVVSKIEKIANQELLGTQLSGFPGLFKERIGAYRLGFTFLENKVIFWMINKREIAYNKNNLNKIKRRLGI